MIELISLIIIFWTPITLVLLKNYLWDLYFWQLKEYRWDRFWTHIRWDHSELNRNYSMITLKFILFSLLSLLFYAPVLAAFAIIATFVVYVFEAFDFIADFFTKKIIRPSVKNIRNLLVLAILIFIILCVPTIISIPFITLLDISTEAGSTTLTSYFNTVSSSANTGIYPDVYILFGLLAMFALFLDLASPFIVPIGIAITWPLAQFKRNMIISRAKKKLRNRKKGLTIVGITGSQGKSTTKEILYQILKDRYKVAKTPENYNTDVGIAIAILSEVTEETEIFIAEMGTYRSGEISKIVESFRPDIGIITDIDTQHVGLFGGYMKLRNAKAEMVQFMKKDGYAILNGDSANIRTVAETINDKFTVLVSSDPHNKKVLDMMENPKLKYVFAENIKETSAKLSFEYTDDGLSEKISVKHQGKHLVNNILIAITAAIQLGLSLNEVSSRLSKINLELPRLTYETGDNNTVVLNDSYNSSHKGFIAAVKYMNHVKKKEKLKKRIVFSRGIYELGKEKKTVYKNLLNNIKEDIDILVSSDPLLIQLAKKDNLNLELHYIKNYQDMIYFFRENANEGDIILLEGRLHPEVIKTIVSDKM